MYFSSYYMVLLSRNQFLRSQTHGQRKEKLWQEKEKTSEKEKTGGGRLGISREEILTGASSMGMFMPENIRMSS